jgi:hypothetical protein
MRKDNEFRCSDSANVAVYTALIFFWLAFPITTFAFLGNILVLILGKGNGDNFINVLVSALALYIVAEATSQMVNQYSHIRVAKEGLYIRVYQWKFIWKLVEWKDVLDVRLSPRLDRWKKSQWVISVRELTYSHKLLSSQLMCGPEPGIVVSSDIINWRELLKIVEERIGK